MTRWPSFSSSGRSRSQHHPPWYEPWTRAKSIGRSGPARRSCRKDRQPVPVLADGREDVDDLRPLRADVHLVRLVGQDAPRAAGSEVRSSVPIRKLTVPRITMPSCSLGWRCSGTTASGSSSTSASVMRSPSTVRAATPSHTRRSGWSVMSRRLLTMSRPPDLVSLGYHSRSAQSEDRSRPWPSPVSSAASPASRTTSPAGTTTSS